MTYALLDSGNGQKLEQFGDYILARPCSQAVWNKQHPELWKKAHASFTRDDDNRWIKHAKLPESWTITLSSLVMKIAPTDFGHLGIFPEHSRFWQWSEECLKDAAKRLGRKPKVLNLFAYSGGATLAAARGGAEVVHLDASKGMTAWARENAKLNQLDTSPIRWITDDVMKFVAREQRRGNSYDAIILDPPTFGRGTQGELFQIENDIMPLLTACAGLLTKEALFVLFSCHTPGFTPLSMQQLLEDALKGREGVIEAGEMTLTGKEGLHAIPSGVYCYWAVSSANGNVHNGKQ